MCALLRLRSAWASAQFDQSLRSALNGVAKDPRFLHADSEDPDQTGRMKNNSQADLSLRWAPKPFFWFCHEAAHFLPVLVSI